MLNHAARVYLPAFQDQLRTSVLGRAMGRKVRTLHQPGAADEDEAKPSLATDEHVRKFFDAWDVGDDDGLREAMGKVVQSWRADNAAGGVPVHAHLPLPKGISKVLARLVGETGREAARPFARVITKLDPGGQAVVAQQLNDAMRVNSIEAYAHGVHNEVDHGLGDYMLRRTREDGEADTRQTNALLTNLLEGASGESNGASQAGLRQFGRRLDSEGADAAGDSGRDRGARRTLEYNEARDGGPRAAPLPWGGEYGRVQSLNAAPYGQAFQTRTSPAAGARLGAPAGARGPLDEDIGEAYDDPDALRPTSKSAAYGPPWYTPGDWRKHRDPRTSGNSLLVGPERLSQAQKKNLADRNWIFPTDGGPEYGPDGVNYPYFGARRSAGGPPTFHGGYDARFRKPAAGSNQKPDKRVVAATRAKFKRFERTDSKGNVINKVIFDLGDGLTLEMLHIEPTPEILAMDRQVRADEARANAARQAGRPVPNVRYPELDAGHPLGEVDALPGKKAHDHTHMQLITMVNGERWTVDITPYMERRARRHWRYPTNDWMERRYDDMFGQDLPPGL